MAGAPPVGSIVDGYRFRGGNHRDPNTWVKVSDAEKAYDKKRAEAQATSDVNRLVAAQEGAQNGYSAEVTANRANALLKSAPVGPMANERIAAGRWASTVPFGDAIAAITPGIPTRRQTADLEELRNIASQGALGDVTKLKGPLSEKELAFIKDLQVDPNATRQGNQRVIDAQKWIARRQAAYGAALDSWARTHGSPSAAAPDGRTFDRWWGQWAAERIPAPGISPSGRPAAKKTGGRVAAAPAGGSRMSDDQLRAALGL